MTNESLLPIVPKFPRARYSRVSLAYIAMRANRSGTPESEAARLMGKGYGPLLLKRNTLTQLGESTVNLDSLPHSSSRKEAAAIAWARSIPLTTDQKRAALVLLSHEDRQVDVLEQLMVVEDELDRLGKLGDYRYCELCEDTGLVDCPSCDGGKHTTKCARCKGDRVIDCPDHPSLLLLEELARTKC